MNSRSSFTLIELLVVIAILAVLSVAVVFIINPADIIKQSRDTNRLTDLNNLNKALAVFDVTNPNDFTGTSSIVYVSLPDSTTTCANLSLPALPAGYTYNCVTSSTLTQADGTGWIPVNFTNVSYGSPIQRLPIDPVNTSSTGEYYSYIVGGSWELNAILSSSKYRNDDDITKTNLPGVLSIGSDKTLNPVYTANGLIAYYKFTEQTGTSTIDSVGAHNGTITPGTGGWTTDNKGNGRAYDFDGANTRVSTTLTANTDFQNGFTISAWIKPETIRVTGSGNRIVDKGDDGSATNGFYLATWDAGSDKKLSAVIDAGTVRFSGSNSISTGIWQHVLVTVATNGTISFYINGVLSGSPLGSGSGNLANDIVTANALTIGRPSLELDRTFDGGISDVRIYNRVLSAAEVQAIYNSTR